MRWVKWYQYADQGMVNCGQMPLLDAHKNLREFSKYARELLEKTGADHVVYGMKVYGEKDRLEAVKFYMKPMSDEEFQKDVANLKNCVIYAAHALKS